MNLLRRRGMVNSSFETLDISFRPCRMYGYYSFVDKDGTEIFKIQANNGNVRGLVSTVIERDGYVTVTVERNANLWDSTYIGITDLKLTDGRIGIHDGGVTIQIISSAEKSIPQGTGPYTIRFKAELGKYIFIYTKSNATWTASGKMKVKIENPTYPINDGVYQSVANLRNGTCTITNLDDGWVHADIYSGTSAGNGSLTMRQENGPLLQNGYEYKMLIRNYVVVSGSPAVDKVFFRIGYYTDSSQCIIGYLSDIDINKEINQISNISTYTRDIRYSQFLLTVPWKGDTWDISFDFKLYVNDVRAC